MKRIIIITKLEPRALQTAVEIGEKGGDNGIILLSDAAFMLINEETSMKLREANTKGVNIYALKNDMEKRGIKVQPFFEIIDYDSLVDILLEPDTKTINL